MSDSVWPYELWPSRLLCPWDSPGKSTRVGCHALLQEIFPTQGSNPGLLRCRQILYFWAMMEAHWVCDNSFSSNRKWIQRLCLKIKRIFDKRVMPGVGIEGAVRISSHETTKYFLFRLIQECPCHQKKWWIVAKFLRCLWSLGGVLNLFKKTKIGLRSLEKASTYLPQFSAVLWFSNEHQWLHRRF